MEILAAGIAGAHRVAACFTGTALNAGLRQSAEALDVSHARVNVLQRRNTALYSGGLLLNMAKPI